MTNKLQLYLLGDVAIQFDNQPLSGLPSRAAEALLIYLACHDRPISREHLAELLWAERTQQQALTNLRTILTPLRRKVGEYLLITRQTIAFDHQAHAWLDTTVFERRITQLAPLIKGADGLSKEDAQSLQDVLDLYKGDFLKGFYIRGGRGFEEWALITRERLRRLASAGLRRLMHHYLAFGDYADGMACAERLLTIAPFDEEALRLMMWMLTRNGQRNAALRQYTALKHRLKKELGVEPTPATDALYERLRALTFPPPVRLPAEPTPFVGREAEIRALQAHFTTPNTRLVTLFGPGGMGKTRLAIEVASCMVQTRPGQFLDGVFFVPLTALRRAKELPLYLGEIVGLAFHGADSPHTQLVEYLRTKEMLLLLDNFEHLLAPGPEGVSLVVEMLRKAPGVKMLVTSRERLNLYEEIVFDTPGLALPDREPENAEAFSAVALFLQTARRVQRDFSPAEDDWPEIARTCRLLEGMPLAIELAASWTRQYPCARIARQIEHSLDFLHTSFRNLPARHRSLRAVFDHSWELLTPPEQAVFCQLTVFEGGFTPDAVASVISYQSSVFSDDYSEDRPLTIDHRPLNTEHWPLNTEHWLPSFADKSLLQPQPDGRYDVHPLLRQFAAEKQVEVTGVLDTVPRRHADYYLNMLTSQENVEEAAGRAAIRADLANIRVAWQFTALKRAHGALARAASALHDFYSAQSWFQEGIEVFQFALDQFTELPAHTPEVAATLCDLLDRKARMHIHIGQLEAGRAALEKAVAHLEHVRDQDQRSAVLGSLAISNYYAGDYPQAEELAGESLRLAQETDNQEGIAFGANFLGSCAKAMGDYERARRYFEKASELYRALDDGIGAAMAFNNLGNLAQVTGDFAAAQRHYEESSARFKAYDHIHGAATTLSNAGLLALKQARYREAEELLAESLVLKEQINDQRGMAVALSGLGDVAAEQGEYAVAWKYLAQALTLAQQVEDIKLTLQSLVAVAALLKKQGQLETAFPLLAFVLAQEATPQETRDRAEPLRMELDALDLLPRDVFWGDEPSIADVVTQILHLKA